MKEAFLGPDGEIPFLDTTPEAFELLLEYIYSGRVCLGDMKDDVSIREWAIHRVGSPQVL